MKREIKFTCLAAIMWFGAAGPKYDWISFAVSWCCFMGGALALHRMVRS